MNAFVGFILFCCGSSFHSVVAVVMAAHHGVWGFEKSDKISENPVFSRLPTFAPIITEESIRLTIPVAFIFKVPPCVYSQLVLMVIVRPGLMQKKQGRRILAAGQLCRIADVGTI